MRNLKGFLVYLFALVVLSYVIEARPIDPVNYETSPAELSPPKLPSQDPSIQADLLISSALSEFKDSPSNLFLRSIQRRPTRPIIRPIYRTRPRSNPPKIGSPAFWAEVTLVAIWVGLFLHSEFVEARFNQRERESLLAPVRANISNDPESSLGPRNYPVVNSERTRNDPAPTGPPPSYPRPPPYRSSQNNPAVERPEVVLGVVIPPPPYSEAIRGQQ